MSDATDQAKDLQRQAQRDLTPTLTIPLRFPKSQARVLRNIVDRLKSEGIAPENVTLFEQAADAARNAEPLMVRCDSLDEVRAMADAFVTFGIRRPSIG